MSSLPKRRSGRVCLVEALGGGDRRAWSVRNDGPKRASELSRLQIFEFLAARARKIVPQINSSVNRHVV
jgi:hypothetical protein